MSPINSDKWLRFNDNATSSKVRVANFSEGDNAIDADFARASQFPGAIFNGKELMGYTSSYRFTDEDRNIRQQAVRDFLSQVVLKEFSGNKDQKERALDHLMKTFHQGGYLNLVGGTLAKDLNAKVPGLTVSNPARELVVTSTPYGFTIEESVEAEKIVQAPGSEYFEQTDEFEVVSEKGKKDLPLIQARAKICVDLTDPAAVKLTIESNKIKINHSGIQGKSGLEKGFLERFIDYIMSLFGPKTVKISYPSTKSEPVSLPDGPRP